MEHVRDDLSAYLDGALAPARRSAVEAHVGSCEACRRSLGELRATARLIAALPAAAPSRRLVPALAPRFNWVRPLRSLSAVGAGMFLLVFMASATLDTGWRMGGGADRARGNAGAAQPASAPSAELAGAPAAPTPAASGAARSSTTLQATATPKAGEVATDTAFSSPRQQNAPGTAGGQDVAGAERVVEPLRIGPSPWLWLALTLLSAFFAVVAHRRLRAH